MSQHIIEAFRNELTTIIRPFQSDALLYPSENDQPIEVVQLPRWQTLLWTRQKAVMEPITPMHTLSIIYLTKKGNESADIYNRFVLLYITFQAYAQIGFWPTHSYGMYYRKTADPCVRELYLLLRFGWQCVGIKTEVVET